MKFRYKINIACLAFIKVTKNGSNSVFESYFFHVFSVNEELKNNEQDPHVNYN